MLYIFDSFTIIDLVGEKKYLLNMNLAVCMEQDTCIVNLPIFEDHKLPKVFCDWSSGFAIKGKGKVDLVNNSTAVFLTMVIYVIYLHNLYVSA